MLRLIPVFLIPTATHLFDFFPLLFGRAQSADSQTLLEDLGSRLHLSLLDLRETFLLDGVAAEHLVLLTSVDPANLLQLLRGGGERIVKNIKRYGID